MSFELSDSEGEFLVHTAREAVKLYLTDGKRIQPPKSSPKLLEKCGVFVTLSTLSAGGEKDLRGCIGYPYPTSPLIEAVIDSALNAATEDPRFEPLTIAELDQVVFEVSVLTPSELIQTTNPKEYLNKIKVGQDGLIVQHGWHKGLLLPQVPLEWGWDEEEFLCQCCIKAGLPPDNWLTKDAKLYKFQALIFEEQTPNGAVKRLNLAPV
ncbi:TIGR00296 family protein [Candidatus Bathycorpusculum sp.]|uniref:TIGR00296 family protein n=1 Tax=Candidatus Bathycorpusculum sp. TaxID=2994959 RepID=UPI0028364C43|nr:TIGR00296 family protein [Candidatus Termitimicrobium sp.]MCL2686132.1 TIGR00296 family protein [Candidatus Termitimicrobium sp.]